MNYLKLKQKIYEAIERNPLDRSAYEEMFQFQIIHNNLLKIKKRTDKTTVPLDKL